MKNVNSLSLLALTLVGLNPCVASTLIVGGEVADGDKIEFRAHHPYNPNPTGLGDYVNVVSGSLNLNLTGAEGFILADSSKSGMIRFSRDPYFAHLPDNDLNLSTKRENISLTSGGDLVFSTKKPTPELPAGDAYINATKLTVNADAEFTGALSVGGDPVVLQSQTATFLKNSSTTGNRANLTAQNGLIAFGWGLDGLSNSTGMVLGSGNTGTFSNSVVVGSSNSTNGSGNAIINGYANNFGDYSYAGTMTGWQNTVHGSGFAFMMVGGGNEVGSAGSHSYFDNFGVVGSGLITKSSNSMLVGSFNEPASDTALAVGIGLNKNDRRNAFEVKKDGSVVLGRIQGDIPAGIYGE